MSVTYLPPVGYMPARRGDSLLRQAVPSGPAYARTARSTRWHLVRSAVDSIKEWRGDSEIDRTFLYYCGQMGYGQRVLTADECPEGEPTCGTCWGRREGVSDSNPDLLFTPRLITPPKVCPGSHTDLYTQGDAWNRGTCLVCGDPVQLRSLGSWHSPRHGSASHQPGHALIDGCEFHAWRDLTTALHPDGHVVAACICKTVESVR